MEMFKNNIITDDKLFNSQIIWKLNTEELKSGIENKNILSKLKNLGSKFIICAINI